MKNRAKLKLGVCHQPIEKLQLESHKVMMSFVDISNFEP